MTESLIHVTANSKEVKKGSIFFALKGAKFDGHLFVKDAVLAGASQIYCEEDPKIKLTPTQSAHCKITILGKETRKKLGELASQMAGNPTHTLKMIGVTGTSGKTTTTYLIHHLLNACGYSCARLGTNGGYFKGYETETSNTTPDPVTLQKWFKTVQEQGATHVVMEVSSHALDQERTWGIAWDGAVFLNLSPEHMDYHPTLEHYFKAKALLFTEHAEYSKNIGKNFYAVSNQDRSYGARLIKENKNIHPYSIREQVRNLRNTATGIEAEMKLNRKWVPVSCPLFGTFQIENILAALSIVAGLGIDVEEACATLPHFSGVPGRMEYIPNEEGIFTFVDYAHKPEALEKVLLSVKPTLERFREGQKLITVFGCGGDRDKTKRPVMGDIATRLSDLVILTNDNPRSENPNEILKEIEGGIQTKNYQVIPDRGLAIETAIRLANRGDIVMIAGKGHETYQIVATPHGLEKVHFDDREEVQKALLKK